FAGLILVQLAGLLTRFRREQHANRHADPKTQKKAGQPVLIHVILHGVDRLSIKRKAAGLSHFQYTPHRLLIYEGTYAETVGRRSAVAVRTEGVGRTRTLRRRAAPQAAAARR